jgi:hypothetical protein
MCPFACSGNTIMAEMSSFLYLAALRATCLLCNSCSLDLVGNYTVLCNTFAILKL